MVTVLDTTNYIQLVKYYRNNPVDFVKEINGYDLTEQQQNVMKKIPIALETGKSISVKSGHS